MTSQPGRPWDSNDLGGAGQEAESKGLITFPRVLMALVALFVIWYAWELGMGDDAGSGGRASASEVRAAVTESYGRLDNVQSYSDRDAPRITVVTNLAQSAAGELRAMEICRTVASVGLTVPDFTGVVVTAGEGGAFLATCDVAR